MQSLLSLVAPSARCERVDHVLLLFASSIVIFYLNRGLIFGEDLGKPVAIDERLRSCRGRRSGPPAC
jgi:hypothetical protein